jgi:hypothetical protein
MVQPQGENIRRAVQWISDERQDNPSKPLFKLIEGASQKFNLSPADATALEHILKEQPKS